MVEGGTVDAGVGREVPGVCLRQGFDERGHALRILRSPEAADFLVRAISDEVEKEPVDPEVMA